MKGPRSRVADAARLLPILAMALLLAPDFFLAGGSEGATAPWLVYLFAAWTGLIALAWWVARAATRRGGSGPRG